MTISGGRTEQLDIFCRVTGFMSDFLSFIDVQLIQFFHGAIPKLLFLPSVTMITKEIYKLTKYGKNWVAYANNPCSHKLANCHATEQR